MTLKKIKGQITFVETNPPNLRGNFTKCNNFEPYGIEILAASAQRAGFSTRILQQNEAPNDEFVKRILEEPPMILALSCMTYNYGSSLNIAETVKKQNPNLKIIVGGPQVSSYPQGLEEALKKGIIDYGIKGEADSTFVNLIENIDDPIKSLGGLIYLDKDELIINPSDKRIQNLDRLPFAIRDPRILNRTEVGRIMYPSQSNQISAATLSYSRGCPFSCTYCDSRNIWGNAVVWRSASNVVDEIELLKEKYGTNTVFFSDLTFNSNKNKVSELCTELIKRKTNISWYVLARVATPDGKKPLINKELLKEMCEAGCAKIGYGLESVIPTVQKEFKKVMSNENVEELVSAGHDLGILSKGFIILGDIYHESKQTLNKTIEVLKKIKFDEIRLSFLTPFPGSVLYEQAKADNSLLTGDFSRYTTDEPILKCRNLSSEELLKARKKITIEYYNSWEYKQMVNKKIVRFPEFRKSYEEHQLFLKESGII